jgi:hypothetical protein
VACCTRRARLRSIDSRQALHMPNSSAGYYDSWLDELAVHVDTMLLLSDWHVPLPYRGRKICRIIWRAHVTSTSGRLCRHAQHDKVSMGERVHCTKIESHKFIYRIHVSSDMRIINISRRAQKHIRPTKSVSRSLLLAHPIVPLLPLFILQAHSFTLVPHQLSFAVFPRSLPSAATPIPACLSHQADERLVFRPLLLFCDAGKVGCAVAAGLQCE